MRISGRLITLVEEALAWQQRLLQALLLQEPVCMGQTSPSHRCLSQAMGKDTIMAMDMDMETSTSKDMATMAITTQQKMNTITQTILRAQFTLVTTTRVLTRDTDRVL